MSGEEIGRHAPRQDDLGLKVLGEWRRCNTKARRFVPGFLRLKEALAEVQEEIERAQLNQYRHSAKSRL